MQCIPVPLQSVFVQCFKYMRRYINANYYYNVPLLPVNSPHRPTDTFPTSCFSTFTASEITLFSFTLPFAIWSWPSEALNSLHYYEGLLELVPNHARNNPWWLVSDCVCVNVCATTGLWLAKVPPRRGVKASCPIQDEWHIEGGRAQHWTRCCACVH